MYFNLNRWPKTLNLRLEKRPPFWAVYAFILVETVGESVLAIPIAVAKIGPLAGIVVLIIIGIVASTIAVVLITGTLNVGIILLLSLLTIPHIHVENFLNAGVSHAGFPSSLFQLEVEFSS